MSTAQGPLAGIKVLDIGTMLAGPLAGGVMADQGAEVIKIEPPGIGDVQRYIGPNRTGLSSLHQCVNRGKRSLALDLKSEQGLGIVLELAKNSDVLIHNFRPGVAEKLGVGYETLAEINPQLIYFSVTGFGHEGPMAKHAAYDNVVQAFAGVAISQANLDTDEPTQYYQLFSDKLTATYASQAITAALFARERGAGGQHVQLAMVDAVANFMWPDVGGYAMFQGEGADPGMQISKGVPLIKFSDGYGQAAPVKDHQFHGYCAAFGVDSSDPRVATVIDRATNKELTASLAQEVARRAQELPVDETIAKMEAADVPCAKAYSLEELPQHPQLQANGLFVESEHPQGGRIVEARNPPHFSKTPSGTGFASATLGQHTDEILAELGFDEGAIAALRSAQVVA